MTVDDLAIKKGILFLAKQGVVVGRHLASEDLRDPKLQKKAINYALGKAQPVVRCSTSFQARFDLPAERALTSIQ